MRKENRKRGKKRRRDDFNPVRDDNLQAPVGEFDHPTPSWIISRPKEPPENNAEAPFGYVDADVKAYFRTVDIQVRQWQDNPVGSSAIDSDSTPSEERQMFFSAALTEISGNERQLATDPECSIILERIIFSMDDFARRVFADSLAGSCAKLITHRFASHVCQTLFNVAGSTISRECRDIYPDIPESLDRGELLTMTQLVLNVCQELLSNLACLIANPFASHVIRALLLLLYPNLSSSHPSSSLVGRAQSIQRSKRSAAWNARQGPLQYAYAESQEIHDGSSPRVVPKQFVDMACTFVKTLREALTEDEVRALAADKVACPVLQILLEVEADQDIAAIPDSLMDKVTGGIITAYQKCPTMQPEPSDFIATLLRDPTSSHLLEIIAKNLPQEAFAILWSTYFQGKLPRLAIHPVANFVVAKAIERVTAEQLVRICEELVDTWQKTIKSSRTGVLRAAIDRAIALRSHEKEIVEAVLSAFDLKNFNDHDSLLQCGLRLMPLQDYKKSLVDSEKMKPGRRDLKNNAAEPKIQGVILLQSLLRLSEPHNQILINSIISLSPDEVIALAHHPASSRVLDVYLESQTIPFKAKRQLVMSLISHFHILADDRIGSRVADRCWAFADPYLKEKIGRSLIPYENVLVASPYGKYFARNLNLYLLQRRPGEWKTMQAEKKRAALGHSIDSPAPSTAPTHFESSRRKRKRRKSLPEDEIDALFNMKTTQGSQVSEAATFPVKVQRDDHQPFLKNKTDSGLQDIFGAIRAAPKGERKEKKKGR